MAKTLDGQAHAMATDSEAEDAQLVDQAVDALRAGDLETAERLLNDVIKRVPPSYGNTEAAGDRLCVKFFDRSAFLHYVQWHKEHGSFHQVDWLGNAYPRAFYYLGFIAAKRLDFQSAVMHLEAGAQLDPSHPLLKFERAQALVHLNRPAEGLSLYQAVADAGVGPHVSPRDLALAWRGCGFALLELGDVDRAQAAYEASCEMEPDSSVARSQLAYIAKLRAGGPRGRPDTVESTGADRMQCNSCGARDRPGTLDNLRYTCDDCLKSRTKPWWAFWR